MRDELAEFWDDFKIPLLAGLIYLILDIGVALTCAALVG